MRLRLILSFFLIVIVATASVTFLARRQSVTAVTNFINRGGMVGMEALVDALETYYAEHQSWEGVDTFFRRQTFGPSTGAGRISNQAGEKNNDGEKNTGGAGVAGGLLRMPNQRVVLADRDGRILIDNHPELETWEPEIEELEQGILLKYRGMTVGYLLPEGHTALAQVATQALTARINQAAVLAGGIATVIALVLALFLSYRLLQPIRELTQAADQLAEGNLEQRVPVRGSDELGTLASTFNHMATSLQLAESRRRAMTADIAHELRTPLAVQRAYLEALEDGIYDLNLVNLKPIEEHNHLLTRLVEDLRMLALADSGQMELVCVPTDLVGLIQRVIMRFGPKAAEQQVVIEEDFDPAIPPLALDAQRIEQILHNLLDNALRYSLEGGTVQVNSTTAGEWTTVTVRDTGPGIPAADLPHIFDRFYRADQARTRTDGGTGLGLSIARKIAQAHGGSLTADNHPEGGAVFTLRLPTA